jgi:hypothetical protein
MIIIIRSRQGFNESVIKNPNLINKFITDFIIKPKELLKYFDNNLIVSDKLDNKTDRIIILRAPSSITRYSDF